MTDEQAIRDLISTWMRATREGDLATVLNLMADDVIFMVPGQEPFGKIKKLQILGNWAYVRTYIDLTVNRDGAPSVHRAGYTLTIMRKQPEGRWLLARDANLMVTK